MFYVYALYTLTQSQIHIYIYMHASYEGSPFFIFIVINLRFECFCFAYSTFIFIFCSFFPSPISKNCLRIYVRMEVSLPNTYISISCQWVSGPVMRRMWTGAWVEMNIRNVLNAERSRLKATLEWFNCIYQRAQECVEVVLYDLFIRDSEHRIRGWKYYYTKYFIIHMHKCVSFLNIFN